jgi:hypothetical protein
MVGNWLLEANTSVVRGNWVSLNHKVNFNPFFIKSEIYFTYNIGSISLTNMELERDYEGRQIFRIMGGLNEMHFGISILPGIQYSLKGFNFRVYGGLAPAVNIKEEPIEVYVAPWDEINRSIYRGYETFVLYGDWGFGIDYWRISLDLRRSNNLTPIIGNIIYEGNTYSYDYETKRLYLILGFNFYPWKPKKPVQSPVL